MAKLYYGSIDFSKLLEEAKKGNKAFSRAQNGKIYLNLNVWINDEKDQYGNDASIQSTFKDAKKEDKFYFGNLKASEPSLKPLEAGAKDIPTDEDDLPF
ncbi:hypothetical protein [Faecalibacter sp. LW9]|uniref:hypothetical protein n=1 Tax=Faecalibacter sp. LW9 TaxID=3103144 RepID=UPI002AFF0F48|nr:hypothetical protein [Faecalibacter sp. LW9]